MMRQRAYGFLLLGALLKQKCRGWSAHIPSPLLGRSPSHHSELLVRLPHQRYPSEVRSLQLSEGGIDDGPPPRSPLTDAFRVQRYDNWAGGQGETGTGEVMGIAYLIAGVTTIGAWAACSVKALSHHPDAALDAICGFRHNSLTIGQALAFPVPVAAAVTLALRRLSNNNSTHTAAFRRLNLGLATSSLWLGASAAYMPAFACGYQLYSPAHRAVASLAHFATALLCLIKWIKAIEGKHKISRLVHGIIGSCMRLAPKNASDDPNTRSGSDGRNEYALCSLLFLWFALMPVAADFPFATVPSILGRRLSRAASGWAFLAAIVSYAIKDGIEKGDDFRGASDVDDSTFRTLRQGLAIGSAAHLVIIALKIIGVDGGGIILPGRGLWEVYPMALSVPFTSASSLIMYLVAVFASRIPYDKNAGDASLGVFE